MANEGEKERNWRTKSKENEKYYQNPRWETKQYDMTGIIRMQIHWFYSNSKTRDCFEQGVIFPKVNSDFYEPFSF